MIMGNPVAAAIAAIEYFPKVLRVILFFVDIYLLLAGALRPM